MLTNMNFTVAGWGATESAPTSEVLLDSNLNYTLNAECESKFRQRVFQFRSQSFTCLIKITDFHREGNDSVNGKSYKCWQLISDLLIYIAKPQRSTSFKEMFH